MRTTSLYSIFFILLVQLLVFFDKGLALSCSCTFDCAVDFSYSSSTYTIEINADLCRNDNCKYECEDQGVYQNACPNSDPDAWLSSYSSSTCTSTTTSSPDVDIGGSNHTLLFAVLIPGVVMLISGFGLAMFMRRRRSRVINVGPSGGCGGTSLTVVCAAIITQESDTEPHPLIESDDDEEDQPPTYSASQQKSSATHQNSQFQPQSSYPPHSQPQSSYPLQSQSQPRYNSQSSYPPQSQPQYHSQAQPQSQAQGSMRLYVALHNNLSKFQIFLLKSKAESDWLLFLNEIKMKFAIPGQFELKIASSQVNVQSPLHINAEDALIVTPRHS